MSFGDSFTMNTGSSMKPDKNLFNFDKQNTNIFTKGMNFSNESSPSSFDAKSFRPPDIPTLEIIDNLKDELKKYIELNALKALVQEAWDDVPRTLNAAMRAGILLAKKEAFLAELEREENEKIRKAKEAEQEKMRKEQERQLFEAEQERLRVEKERQLYEAQQERLRAERLKASQKPFDHMPSFSSKDQFKTWCLQEAWLEAALLRKGLFMLKKIMPSVESQPRFKSERMDLRKKIRPKLGQVVNSKAKVVEIISHIDSILNSVKRTSVPLYYWTLNFISKQAIKQAETEFSINPATSFPLARTLIGLMQRHPLLRKFLLIRLYKKCPSIVPGTLPVLTQNVSEDDYRKRLGYLRNDNQWEANESFIVRQGGMFSLYCSFFQYDENDNESNSFGPKDAWVWLQRFLLAPIIPSSSKILTQFLQNCGFKLQQIYVDQFTKLLRYIRAVYVPKLSSDTHAHNVRLELCLDEYFKSKCSFEAPEGRNYPPGDGGVFKRTPFKSRMPTNPAPPPPSNNYQSQPSPSPDQANHSDDDDDWGSFL